VQEFFTSAGYQIAKLIGLKCPGAIAIAQTPRSRVMSVLKELAAEKPDAILQPGTNLATARLAAEAGEWLGMPVISCNTATYWYALRSFGIKDQLEGFGPLLSEF
jgi:maleate isomerase